MVDYIPTFSVVDTADGWKYTAFFDNHYVEFDDAQILDAGDIGGSDGPGRWASVIPQEFWQNVHAAGIVTETSVPYGDPDFRTYTFIKGDDLIVFRDNELIERTTLTEKWPGLKTWLAGGPLHSLDPVFPGAAPWKILATSGKQYCFFSGSDGKIIESGVIAKKWYRLPSHFEASFDSVAVLPTRSLWTYIATKGGEVVIFNDSKIIEGPLPIAEKWPHLWQRMRSWDGTALDTEQDTEQDTGEDTGMDFVPGAILRKVSTATWPGFEDFQEYFRGCSEQFWSYRSNHDVKRTDSAIVFGGPRVSDMLRIMDQPEFRMLHNLLPAGTDAVTAFCQIYALKYRDRLGLQDTHGTYTINFEVWSHICTENIGTGTVQFRYKIDSNSAKAVLPLTICL